MCKAQIKCHASRYIFIIMNLNADCFMEYVKVQSHKTQS